MCLCCVLLVGALQVIDLPAQLMVFIGAVLHPVATQRYCNVRNSSNVKLIVLTYLLSIQLDIF